MTLLQDPPPSEDGNSRKEIDDLFGDNKRGEYLKKHIHFMVCASLYIASFLYACMILVWVWHITAPHCYRWLEELEVHMLERIVFGGTILVTFAAKYFKKYNVV
jgi:hypothetical protein